MERQAVKAIETSYKGYRFRSRLEARWAVFFDALGIAWEYEPEGFDLGSGLQYLPDFWLPDEKAYAEVKADMRSITQQEWLRMTLFARERRLFILDGLPAARMYQELQTVLCGHDSDALPRPPFEPVGDACRFERAGWTFWSSKGRFWWDEHSNYFSPTTDFGNSTRIENAAEKARAARFSR